jgi:uncharacterized protein with ParB-like and HNH nuclease domain
MPDPYRADVQTVGDILSLATQPLRVPLYQRPYSWRPSEVREFWLDVTDFGEDITPGSRDDQYFLGSIVVVDQADKLEILDGQQRLATATIVLAAIRNALIAAGDPWTDHGKSLNDYIAKRPFGSPDVEYRLELSKQDRVYYRERIQDRVSGPKPRPGKYPGHKRIHAAANLVEKLISDYGDQNGGPRSLVALAQVLLQNVTIVVCKSTNYLTAASIFETLNTRGIELSTSDLLRTWLLGKGRTDARREEIASAWDPIYAMHDVVNTDDFVRHYWISHRDKPSD